MAQRTIPVISNIPQLAQWQAGLRGTLKSPNAPKVVANFNVVSKQGGNYLSWAQSKEADGYIVEISENGDFAVTLSKVQLPGNDATTYFDTVPTANGATPVKRFYRVRATSGTIKLPQTVFGKPTAVLSSTAISPDDTVTAPTTVLDTSDRDVLNVGSGRGDYRLSLPPAF